MILFLDLPFFFNLFFSLFSKISLLVPVKISFLGSSIIFILLSITDFLLSLIVSDFFKVLDFLLFLSFFSTFSKFNPLSTTTDFLFLGGNSIIFCFSVLMLIIFFSVKDFSSVFILTSLNLLQIVFIASSCKGVIPLIIYNEEA